MTGTTMLFIRLLASAAALGAIGLFGWSALSVQDVMTTGATGGVVVITVVAARTVHRTPAWAVHHLGDSHRELIALIDAAPNGCTLIDPLDEVALICHHDSRSRERTLTRIAGSEFAAIPDSDASCVLIERFHTESGRVGVVAHRIELWSVILDDAGRLTSAAPLSDPPPYETDSCAAHDMLRITGVGFAVELDVRLAVEQLRRAMSDHNRTDLRNNQ